MHPQSTGASRFSQPHNNFSNQPPEKNDQNRGTSCDDPKKDRYTQARVLCPQICRSPTESTVKCPQNEKLI